MSFLKSTPDLKREVLNICGELTDGSSPYDDQVVEYLNDVYQGLLAGGNEFGIDIAEPWVWAQAKRPILLSLLPAEIGAATLTNGSNDGVFSVAPTLDLVGRYFRVEARPDIYRIVKHGAGQTAFSLDQAYLADSGTLNFTAYKLDYDVIDDSIIIDSSNYVIAFRENASATLFAYLTYGAYTPTELCAAIKAAMDAAGSQVYTVTFNSDTRKFFIGTLGSYLDLMFAGSGSYVENSISAAIGFDIEDQTGSTGYFSDYALNGVLRLTKPITMYREAPTYAQAAKDIGKIFMIDDNTFLREYPLNRLTQDIPDKFCVVEMGPTGLWKVRMNASVLDAPVRAEVNHIPVTRKLVDNDASIPLVPGSYSKYLVYGAAHFILLDKSDNKAEQYFNLARAKLLALVNDNRKGVSLAGNNFGRLIPRQGGGRILRWGR